MAAPPTGLVYFIGLGLGDHRDVTARGAAAIAASSRVFLEAYTSVLGVSPDALEAAFGKRVELAHRETVESESDTILGPAIRGETVAFLVVGDPFGATTHTDLLLRARAAGVRTAVVHNASIMNAVGACGLQLYAFGATISLPFFRDGWEPDSFYDRVAHNAAGGLHTLCLLDIKVREPDFDELVRSGRRVFRAPRFMTVNRAVRQLLLVEARRGGGVCGPATRAFGVARVGQESERIVAGTLAELLTVDFGPPLHSLVLVGGPLHDMEAEMERLYAVRPEDLGRAPAETGSWDEEPPRADSDEE
jgi:diphthine synthase